MQLEKITKTIFGVEGEETFLDLSQKKLFCFQEYVDKGIISKMLGSIMAGKEFPPVGVVKINDDTYSLTILINSETGGIDGGHHRAYAHFVAEEKLRCIIIPSKYQAFHKLQLTVRDMRFKDNNNLL